MKALDLPTCQTELAHKEGSKACLYLEADSMLTISFGNGKHVNS